MLPAGPQHGLHEVIEQISLVSAPDALVSPHRTTALLELLSYTGAGLFRWVIQNDLVEEQHQLLAVFDILRDSIDPNDANKTRIACTVIVRLAQTVWVGDTANVEIFQAWAVGVLERMLQVYYMQELHHSINVFA